MLGDVTDSWGQQVTTLRQDLTIVFKILERKMLKHATDAEEAAAARHLEMAKQIEGLHNLVSASGHGGSKWMSGMS